MALQPGTTVKSTNHPEKGPGLVVGVQTIFNCTYVDVFFDKTTEKMTFPEEELVCCEPPDERLKKGIFSCADRFMLRLLAEDIRCMGSKEGLHSAGNFKIIPLPHQLLAVNFVLDQFKPRALIADEVGLGKTIEAALIYEELKARGIARKVLVVVPSGLVGQWEEEMRSKFFEVFSRYDRETVVSLKNLHGEETNVWTLSDKIITSIDFIKPRKVTPELGERTARGRQWHNTHVSEAVVQAGFDVVIIDEAHKLTKDMSGEETARFKIGKALSETVPIVLLLTATPHQGDSARFRNLLNLIDPYLFYRNSDLTPENVKKVTVRNNKRAAVDFNGNRIFKQRITSLYTIKREGEEYRDEVSLYHAVSEYVSEFYDMARRHNDRTMMFLLLLYQRMVSSSSRAILKSLSLRLDTLLEIRRVLAEAAQRMAERVAEDGLDYLEDLAPEEQLRELERYAAAREYGDNINELETEIAVLKRCVSLAQKAVAGRNDAKFVKLLEVIDEFRVRENDPGLKFIIFTEFVETQQYLKSCLESLGYATALINGGMSPQEKQEQKQRFREEAQFLISTDAGGEGINLQFCRVMVNCDLPWNPMRLEQRIGRIDRIGQEHDVKIINFQLDETVEQRVREVIETKLEVIRTEFNDGEDKLADILSTLQDEFSFEDIYINAVARREADREELEELGRQIYERAKEIIREGQLMLPFSDLQEKYRVSPGDITGKTEKARRLVERFLQVHGGRLVPYKGKAGMYYFDDPLSGKRISHVIFDPAYSLENEDFNLLSLGHPYVRGLIKHLGGELEGDVTARVRVRESRFAGIKGFLFVYRLTVNNYVERPREYLVPCFVDGEGRVNNRISLYFGERDDVAFSPLVAGELEWNRDAVCEAARDAAAQRAETLFYELREEYAGKAAEEEKKMEKFYSDKETSVRRIAVDNIREAKLRELEQDRQAGRRELAQRQRFVPSLELLQAAYVEFEG